MHDRQNTRTVKIMIGFEITAVHVDAVKEGPRRIEVCDVHLLEGDSAQRLSHHYHQ